MNNVFGLLENTRKNSKQSSGEQIVYRIEEISTHVYMYCINICMCIRVVHGSDEPVGRVGSRFCRILAGRVSTSDLLVFY